MSRWRQRSCGVDRRVKMGLRAVAGRMRDGEKCCGDCEATNLPRASLAITFRRNRYCQRNVVARLALARPFRSRWPPSFFLYRWGQLEWREYLAVAFGRLGFQPCD